MNLYINTIIKDKIIIGIKDADDFVVRMELDSVYRHSETLLPEIEKMLRNNQIDYKNIKNIEVEKSGGSFSSLRIGILTANALAYGWGIGVNGKDISRLEFVSPEYSGLPNISQKKT